MSDTEKKPSLRFSEFIEPWENITFIDISTSVMYGMNSSAIAYDGKNGYIRITDIDDYNCFSPSPITSPDGLIEDKFRLKNGDIVFARTGATTGKSYLYKESDGDLYFAGFLIKASIIDAYPEFVFQNTFRSKYDNWVHVMSMRSGQPGINAEEYKSYKFKIPVFSEQQKIADFLSSVDKKISLLKNKQQLLIQYKKGVMQQLFSQQIRFKDENGQAFPDWKYKKGNKIFRAVSNKKHNSDLPILAITQNQGAIPRELINYKVQVTDNSVASYKVVEKGDFIISLRSFQGGIEYSNYKGICSPAYIILQPSIGVDDDFYKYYLKTHNFIQEMKKRLEGIRDGKILSYKYFSEIDLPYPCVQEQKKISDFINSLDKKIDLVNQQIELTQTFKKGLLQQMFV